MLIAKPKPGRSTGTGRKVSECLGRDWKYFLDVLLFEEALRRQQVLQKSVTVGQRFRYQSVISCTKPPCAAEVCQCMQILWDIIVLGGYFDC